MASAQTTATVSRIANLRRGPSSAQASIRPLMLNERLTLVEPAPQSGYYRVRTEQQEEGWVWGHNIRIDATTALSMARVGPTCDSGLWAHVYHGKMPTAKDRLVTIQPCIAVTGTIMSATAEKDGDWHVRVKLDPAFEHLINNYNTSGQHGYLVVEPMCSNPVKQTDTIDEGVCKGFSQTLFNPSMKNKHVVIIGVYVTDAEHGWNEIHPVTSIEVK
jgi:uncharacterized protein YgiM (DUF1202 family)